MMTKHLYIIIICLFCTLAITVRAQYYSVNYDEKTIAAMAAAYASGAVVEGYYNKQVQEILKHYNAAEVASAGIFASKYLERKAMTDLGIWSSSTENYYYRRIYDMVANKIMPKIWTVGGLMLKYPQNALYWGSYLMKICDDVKSLCYQFESVVTNSTLSFSDIQFLTISSEVAELVKLSEFGGVDFKTLLDDLSNISGTFTKENLQADIDKLYENGVSLATAGTSFLSGQLLQGSQFNELFNSKLSAVSSAVTFVSFLNFAQDAFSNNFGKAVLAAVGGAGNVSGLFDTSEYNLTSWMTDYVSEASGQYYTQRWYIYRVDSGTETVCSYSPPTDADEVISGSHWYRISTTDTDYSPSSSEREAILQNSESHAGYSRSWVNQMNSQNDGYTYAFASGLKAYTISRNGNQRQKAYAYNIIVTKSWYNKEEVYEDVFDSYSMELSTFKAQLNARLSELNDNEEGYTYYLGSDSKKYYQTTDATKLNGIETVTISVTCSDGIQLAEGTTSYKCSTCGSSLNAHCKECAMKTSVTEDDLDLSDLNSLLTEATSQVTSISATISALEQENDELIKKISTASITDAAEYRKQYNANLSLIEDYETQLAEWEAKQKEYQEAVDEANEGESEETDDYYRIPAIMADCKTAYNLTWQDEGSWSGYTFTRTATMPNINGVITFSATLSIARKPKYFMGIKIHRAILQISWELTSEYSDTQVVEVMNLDQDKSDEDKADEVNKRISEIAQEYPDCEITTEYNKSNGIEEDNSDDVQHLLWSSDRLEIAREVDSRITKIYSDLVILEKYMYYKLNIINVLKGISPWQIDDEQGRRRTLVDEAYQRWRENGDLSNKDN